MGAIVSEKIREIMLLVINHDGRDFVETSGRMLGKDSIVPYNSRQIKECSPSEPSDSAELRVGLERQRDGSASSLFIVSINERHGKSPVTNFRLVPIIDQHFMIFRILPYLRSYYTVASTLSCQPYKVCFSLHSQRKRPKR